MRSQGLAVNQHGLVIADLLEDPDREAKTDSLYGRVKYWPDRSYWVFKRNDVPLPPAEQTGFPVSNW